MFADDVTLLAAKANTAQLVSIIKDVRDELQKHGLNLNMDKCLVQTNHPGVKVAPIKVDGTEIPMVSSSVGFKFLGTQYTLTGRCSAEIRARVAAAWGKLNALWPLLGKRDGNLDKRLRLFDASVSQTLLWCCESWLITQKEKQLLRTTQHAMLRRIAGLGRQPEESWVEWIQRSTRRAVSAAKETGIRMWVDAHLRSKWSWGRPHMSPDRLARRAVEWRDSAWWASEVAEFSAHLRSRRPHRTHWFRWEDDLKRYAAKCGWTSWQCKGQLRTVWRDHCESFVQFARK